ncbi:exported protein of unknown function [Methylacidimicrobium sp. AP8]|nr:exported protein of unknown function [Methylacidimicrobium sp. AP8]
MTTPRISRLGRRSLSRSLRLLCLLLPLFRALAAGAALLPPTEAPVDHFILLFQENHSPHFSPVRAFARERCRLSRLRAVPAAQSSS